MRRETLRWVLGGLWLLDGLLQLQPAMFTMAMVQGVMQPATAGNPSWVNIPLEYAIRVFSHHIAVANAGVAAIQLTIGLSLLLAGRRRWPYALSLAWALLLWPFGQAFGDLLSGSASLWTGAPGSAVLYALLTWAAWPSPGDAATEQRRGWLRLTLGGLWALGALLQTNRAFFTGQGLAALVSGNIPGQPVWMAALLAGTSHALSARPVLYNAVAIGLLAALALGIWSGRWSAQALALSILVSVVAWVPGQAFGGLLTGMGTDPNTAPLLALLALSVWPPRADDRSRAAA